MSFLFKSFIMRCSMVMVWTGLIFLLLYMPRIGSFLYQEKSVNLFVWPMILDANIFTQFEEETGIKVYVNYYESNEELYSKLQATQGKGYDVIVPTDYMAEQLIKEGFVKKIDKTRLNFLDRLQPSLMGHYFDLHNNYSVPYYTSIYGLGINKNFFDGSIPEASWALVFGKQPTNERIGMIDSAREAILLASLYLYGDIAVTDQHLPALEKILSSQKEWVEIYTSSRAEEVLASGSCPVAVVTSTEIWKALREYPAIEFVVPKEGSFVTIDSCMLSAATHKNDEVYKLINFLYRPDIVRHNTHKYGFCSPVTGVEGMGLPCYPHSVGGNILFFKNVLTRKQVQDLWTSVKSH